MSAVIRLAVVLSLLLVSPAASAFCRTSTDPNFVPTAARPCDTANLPLFWASKCVGYSVNRAASSQVPLATAQKLVAEAFAEWDRHDCAEGGGSCNGPGKASLVARDLGPVECAEVEHIQGAANANIIIFRDGVWPHEGTALALTTVTFKVDSGEIYDVDMEVQSNPAEVKLGLVDPLKAGEYDLKSILTHEAGHFLGLAHSVSATQPTMFTSYRAGETFMRDLSADDICGLCTANPPKRVANCDSSPRGGLASGCGGVVEDKGCGCSTAGHGSDSSFVVVLAALAMGVARARSSRCARRSSSSLR